MVCAVCPLLSQQDEQFCQGVPDKAGIQQWMCLAQESQVLIQTCEQLRGAGTYNMIVFLDLNLLPRGLKMALFHLFYG